MSEQINGVDSSLLKPIVIFRPKLGEMEVKLGRNSVFVFWPRLSMSSVHIGLMAKTGLMLKTYNKWSREKSKSVAFLVLGIGIGFCRSYEET